VIERMPPRRREAFLLCRIEELTYAQAGRRMGVTVHAIEKHMSAAMAQLHAELSADQDVA
jgi:RNA polymerase sigma-70 factor (ECF subfamily)